MDNINKDFSLKQNGIAKILVCLAKEFYIAKRQDVFVKISKTEKKKREKECTLLAA